MRKRIEFTVGEDIHTYRYPSDNARYAIILCHGAAGWGGMYDPFCYPMREKSGADIWALDCPGFGLSGRARGDFTIKEFEAALDAVIAEIRTHHDRPIFTLGNSMGGVLASIGFYKNDIAGVCVSASPLTVTSPSYLEMKAFLNNPSLQALYDSPFAEHIYISLWDLMNLEETYGDPEFVRKLKAHILHADRVKLKSWASLFNFDAPYPLTENKKPFFFVCAKDDPMFPAEAVSGLLNSVGGPKEYHLLDTDRHGIVEQHTEDVVEKLSEWIDGHI